MKKLKCNICGRETVRLVAIPPFPEDLDLRKHKSFTWVCMICYFKKIRNNLK